MKKTELIKEILSLPDLVYTYYKEDSFVEYYITILGGAVRGHVIDESRPLLSCGISDYNFEMQKLYEQEYMNEREKSRFIYLYQRIQRYCYKLYDNYENVESYEKYFERFTDNQLEEIEEQVIMYKVAIEELKTRR